MLRVNNNQLVKFRFGFLIDGDFYDPLDQESAIDIYATVVRGQGAVGDIIHSSTSLINSSYRIIDITPPLSIVDDLLSATFTFDIDHKLSVGDTVTVYGVGGGYDGEYTVTDALASDEIIASKSASTMPNLDDFDNTKYYARATLKSNAYFVRVSNSEYNFYYKIPDTLFGGVYTATIQTSFNDRSQIIEHPFEVSRSQIGRSGKVVYKKIEDGTITLSTDIDHNLSVGDLISLIELSSSIDGKYYVNSIPANNQFTFTTTQQLTNSNSATSGTYVLVNTSGVSKDLTGPTSGATISKRPIYDNLDPYATNSILLIGHCDNLELNQIYRVSSLQEATNLIGANTNSPLLRGVYDAFSCGAKSIFILAAAPMSEYIEDVDQRLTDMPIFVHQESQEQVNFYEKYYERLTATYQAIEGYELIDIVVPLETSMIGTGSVDFLTQLAVHCYTFNDITGYVQMGIIGSKSNGVKDSDIDLLEAKSIFRNKLTTFTESGEIESDIGRYIIPIYGELTFNHIGFSRSYTSSAAAAFAGLMSANPVYNGMIRKRLPGAYSLFGNNLSKESFARLENLNINTVYRSKKAQRGNPYEVYISNDYTLANINSSFIKAPQMRLVAMVINEIKNIANDGMGKNAEDKVVSQVESMLNLLMSTRVIRDYSMQSYASKTERGSLIFEINLVSSLGLKNINFSIITGPGA
jgi:hypothetical protein